MNGFLIIGINNTQENLQTKFFEQYLNTNSKKFQSYQLNSTLFDNLIGYQFFNEDDFTNNSFKTNVFLNGKIFGGINENSTRKLSYNESLSFISENVKQNNSFFGFDGSCSLVVVKDNSIVFQNDIEGYKKVFYYESEDVFCVSSNLTYILKIIKKKWKIRKNAVFSYILQRESKWPLTFIEGIKVLQPLTKATLTENGINFRSATFSNFYDLNKINKKDLIDDVYSSYKRIIKREKSDNIAVTLSGGYDSNCLTKLYTQVYDNKFTAVSLGYQSKREKDSNVYDETVYAEKIAAHLKIPFKKYIIDKEYFLLKIDSFIKSLDQPGHDPSSNFLLNNLLRKDGFDTVVTGMGGDAFFSSKTSLKLSELIYKIAANSGSYNCLNYISKQLDFKRILKIFDTESFLEKPKSFIQLRELQKINKNSLDRFLNKNVKQELFKEIENRLDYYNKINKSSKVNLEQFYSYSVFSNPGEYHADIMAVRNNLNIIMPFVNITPVLKLLNGSQFVNITSREFEMEIFKGINKELLLKSKSGFSFPYTEWAEEFFEETISFFKDNNYFNNKMFNISKFADNFKKDENVKNSISANQLIWKLTVVKRYIEYHSLEY